MRGKDPADRRRRPHRRGQYRGMPLGRGRRKRMVVVWRWGTGTRDKRVVGASHQKNQGGRTRVQRKGHVKTKGKKIATAKHRGPS